MSDNIPVCADSVIGSGFEPFVGDIIVIGEELTNIFQFMSGSHYRILRPI